MTLRATSETPKLEILPLQDKQFQPEDKPFGLTCRGSQENPSLFTELRWISPRGEELKTNDKIVVTPDTGRITLHFLSPKQDDTGVYKCTANFQNSEPKSAEVSVTFYKDITWEECKLQQALVKGRSGERITCKVTASPSPSVSWKKNGKNLNDQRYVIENTHISVKGEVTEEDAGNYEVQAEVEYTGNFDFRTIA
ncbi:Fasciclin-2-like protein, partial [Leptotrombidium deliense]